LVEDNLGDIDLVREALDGSNLVGNLFVARDGIEALAMLRKEGAFSAHPTPNLILLDLNLPKKDGRELLSEIKRDDSLKRIPVIVLTTSEAESDIAKCYDLHANCYIVKPVDFDDLSRVIKIVEEFWLKAVKLPPY
jgi:two-component system response regulator